MNGITAYSISKTSGHSRQKIYKAIGNQKGIESIFGLYFMLVGDALKVSAGDVIDTVREMEAALPDELVNFGFNTFKSEYYIEKKTNKTIKRKKVVTILLAEVFMKYYFNARKNDQYIFQEKSKKYFLDNASRFLTTNKRGEKRVD